MIRETEEKGEPEKIITEKKSTEIGDRNTEGTKGTNIQSSDLVASNRRLEGEQNCTISIRNSLSVTVESTATESAVSRIGKKLRVQRSDDNPSLKGLQMWENLRE